MRPAVQRMHTTPAPQYSLMKDQPWIQQPGRKSLAPSASIYSEDEYQNTFRDSVMPDIPPLKVQKEKQNHHHHQHSLSQEIPDHGPQVRQSRLPIFRQVRSMLHKPSKLDMSKIGRPRESSQSRKSAGPEVKQPSRKPSRDAYEVRRHWPETPSSKENSPVSALRDSDMERSIPPGSDWQTITSPNSNYERTPVSDVADFAYQRRDAPSQVSANARANALPETPCPTARLIEIKRKPAPRSTSQSENIPPLQPQLSPSPPPSRDHDCQSVDEISRGERYLNSRFSWTTYGGTTPARPSFDLGSRPSMDRPSTGRSIESEPRYGHQLSRLGEDAAVSRFSWSTVHSGLPPMPNINQNRPDSPPPSPPAIVPTKYKAPPVQSILSRHRPVPKHQEREEWNPQSTRKVSSSTPTSPVDSEASATKSRKLNIITSHHQRSATEEAPGSTKKTLPPPPDILSPTSSMSHLENLLAKEQDMLLQRRNIEKAIAENAKIENASPMDVAFAEVRQAKKELETLRGRLEEIRLEEREIGISIARARRKEGLGEDEGLWVRRVTG